MHAGQHSIAHAEPRLTVVLAIRRVKRGCRRWLAACLAASAVAACGAGFKSGLPPVDLGGNWTGSLSSAAFQSGSLHLVIGDQPLFQLPHLGNAPLQHVLTGNWTVAYALQADDDSGTAQGMAVSSTDTVTLTLTDSLNCTMNLLGTRTGKPSISGHYTNAHCPVADSGTFMIERK